MLPRAATGIFSSQATMGLASFAAGAVFAAGLAIYMSARRRRRDGRILPSGDLTYDLEMT
jgi:phosphotransferase system  glucose/maltose/N-acetylglucosamine-specific IIC component